MEKNPLNKSPETIKVLVVDDEQDIRDACERIISKMGCHVDKATRGDEALEMFGQTPYSIVLLDMKMPGMDGLDVLGHIMDQNNETIVIVITGYATVETAIKAMKLGAYDFIPKPFETDQLRIVVGRALEKQRLRDEREKLEKERKRTLADLAAEKSRVRTIVESLPNGVMVTNIHGQVVLMNLTFRWHLGLDEHQDLGDLVNECVADDGFCTFVREISQGKHMDPGNIPSYEFSLSDEKYLQVRGRPVLGDHGECLGAVVVTSDITTIKILDRLKSEFVAKVSHELRSPLSTIHEQLAMVIRDLAEQAEPEQDLHMLSRAKEKTSGLISLIGDLLDLSRIESGTVCQEPRPVQLEDLLESIVDFLKIKGESKKQILTFKRPDKPLPKLTADPLSLESIFGNLITNAIHYTPENGDILVDASLENGRIRVDIIDNGFGIAEKHIDKIFERFYRVKDENTRYITGTGLGLPIVKGLVDSLKGSISVKSQPGKGSTFTVLLPVG
jgi:two-component system, OmpR family, phosphate regulon sensor histidine kinase PhoR